MSRTVLLPPDLPLLPDGTRRGGWWHDAEEGEGRLICDLCPRECHLKPGDRGFCFVRENRAGEMVLSTYGRSTGFCIDPVEKKPLNQFYPGTSVLSFGTAGCNLGCKFCQNWDISKSREIERLSEQADPESVAAAARRLECRSVAFTYNDPVVWAEYAIDTARACRAAEVKTIAVTAGYITPQARGPFYEFMDAANVDLKGFTEDFYYKLTASHLAPVLDTLRWLRHETNVWLEITNLIIPRANDSHDELRRMCDWVLEAVGPDVPLHFTAFHPDFRLTDRERTPTETLLAAYDIAARAGLHYVYVGNVHSPREQTTYCPGCKRPVIERSGYQIAGYALNAQRCRHCGAAIAGCYDDRPGTWGSRRQPVRIADFQTPRLISLDPLSPASPPVQTATPVSAPVQQRPQFTLEQDRAILQAGAEILAATVEQRPPRPADPTLGGAAALPVLGVFVTAKRRGRLRSCCGAIGQIAPLAEAVAYAAERTANDDPRFPPISAGELPYLDIDVWVLHSLAPLTAVGEARRAAIVIGQHGLIVARGGQRGLLLPGVAVEHRLDAEAFLRQVCLKASLPPQAWKDPDVALQTFEGHEVAGPLTSLVPRFAATAAPLAPSDILALAEFTRGNIVANIRGATPSYYAFHVSDANVNGVVATFRVRGDAWWQAQRISIRERLPLQSTLFGLAESLGRAAANAGVPDELARGGTLELTVLYDVQVHGSAADPDLRGIEPKHRALWLHERGKSAAIFNPQGTAESLLSEARQAAKSTQPEDAGIYSLGALSNVAQMLAAQVPAAQAGANIRPAAVAGTFYPAAAAELSALVDRCLDPPSAAQERVAAIMVPHAGLMYSGRLAAQTWQRVEIPETVIILGPKHTPNGVDWSIAPHAAWQLPGGTVAADPELAARLAAAIPGLELDAAAHAREHAIETELPFLQRLAPHAKVVGIVIGGGDWERCRDFARGLAAVIRTLPEPPLLVISSDMNHFAADVENRRLDELALAALETLDPARLLRVVRENDISMCGVLPAVIVLQTLRELGGLQRVRRVGYCTSADVSGDSSRVVGYAGLLVN